MKKAGRIKRISKRSSVVKGRKIEVARKNSGIKSTGSSSKRRPTKTASRLNTKDDLTKNFLETAARKSTEEAAEETMKVMGYNIIAKNGWIVKVFPNNKMKRISPIPRVIEKK
jgi:hypothetical protein